MKKLLLILLFSVVLLLGCTSDGTGDGANDGSDDGAGDGDNGDQVNNGDNGDNGDAGDAPNFLDVISSPATAYKHRYTFETQGMLSGDASGEVTMYLKYPKMRLDSEIDFEGQAVEGRTYIDTSTGGDYIVCTNYTGDWTCMAMPKVQYDTANTAADQEASDSVADAEANPNNYTITYEGTKQVIGTTTQCFKMVPNDEPEKWMKVCYSAYGVAHYMEAYNGEYTTITETIEFSTNVTDADFEPPIEPTNMDDLFPDDFDPSMIPGME